MGKPKLDDDTPRELGRKKLCFNCQEPWVPRHRCSSKGKAHYIEVYLDSGDDGDETDQEQEGLQVAEEEQQQAETQEGIIATMSSIPRFHTFRV